MSYVKPHGALYNTIANDKRQAMAVINAICQIDANLILVALAGSALIGWAKQKGLHVVAETFADRSYHVDGTLVSRKKTGAVLDDPELVAERMLQLVRDGGVTSIEGKFVTIKADSICVHGDSAGALAMAQKVREKLQQNGITITLFTKISDR